METIDIVKANKKKADEIARLAKVITTSQKAQVEHQRELRGTQAQKAEDIKKQAEPITTELKKITSLSDEEKQTLNETQLSEIKDLLSKQSLDEPTIRTMMNLVKEGIDKINKVNNDTLKKKYIEAIDESFDKINNPKREFIPMSAEAYILKDVLLNYFLNETAKPIEIKESSKVAEEEKKAPPPEEKAPEAEAKVGDDDYNDLINTLRALPAKELYGDVKTVKGARRNITIAMNAFEVVHRFKIKQADRNDIREFFVNQFLTDVPDVAPDAVSDEARIPMREFYNSKLISIQNMTPNELYDSEEIVIPAKDADLKKKITRKLNQLQNKIQTNENPDFVWIPADRTRLRDMFFRKIKEKSGKGIFDYQKRVKESLAQPSANLRFENKPIPKIGSGFQRKLKKQSNPELLHNLQVHMAEVKAGNDGLKEPIKAIVNEAKGRGILKPKEEKAIVKHFC